jgi:nucleoside 2-deoxyribosyltransferase
MKIYVASAFENKHMVRQVYWLLGQWGHEVTYDWTRHEPTEDRLLRQKYALADIMGVQEADALLLLQPGNSGTHVELGAALSYGLPVAIVGENERNSIFYDMPGVRKFKTAVEALFWLEDVCLNHKVH